MPGQKVVKSKARLRKILVACTLLLPLERCQVLVERVVTFPHLLKSHGFMMQMRSAVVTFPSLSVRGMAEVD